MKINDQMTNTVVLILIFILLKRDLLSIFKRKKFKRHNEGVPKYSLLAR